MGYAVVHVIGVMILVELYRTYIAKKKFSSLYVVLAGVAGLLPDIDIPISWAINILFETNIQLHRLYTHSLLWAVILLALGGCAFLLKEHTYTIRKWIFTTKDVAISFVMLGIGVGMHVVLDCVLSATMLLTWIPGIPIAICPPHLPDSQVLALDAAILVLWLLYHYWKHPHD